MYFVCETCNAKWFCEPELRRCPRCGALAASRENIAPPWKVERKKMLTIKQAAERLNVSIGLVYKLVNKGQLRAYRIASALRISEEELDEYLRRNESGAPAGPAVSLRRLSV